ncbi:39S ribosomal protein L21, mitochondrial [Zootermopsis nevadensis]|uniref:Large ribosomal subunit protein bL21m n=1 Tax=Zootermopsis nevadensis TaxID=136037 RepID=A0A067RS94_ZOONE|nr:39S ribosomal protein L21, mitochondrial [Zootermopsis nevadensis]KDR22679.1 39S ribosomal protein L21, mitochondrial [Zootermopsis nevadensis]
MSVLNKFTGLLVSLNKLALSGCVNKHAYLRGYAVRRPLWSTTTTSHLHSVPETQKMILTSSETTEEEQKQSNEIISKVNKQLQQQSEGRLFAVVHICGKQFKVTTEDLIIIEGHWAPQIGDELKLEKVLLAGGTDFTLIGRPVLSSELVLVHATVIEKALSHIKTVFKKKRRKQFQRINFQRTPHTMLRINSIQIKPEINVKKDVEGLESRIF